MENILKKLLYAAALLWCTIFLQGVIPLKMNHTVSRVNGYLEREGTNSDYYPSVLRALFQETHEGLSMKSRFSVI